MDETPVHLECTRKTPKELRVKAQLRTQDWIGPSVHCCHCVARSWQCESPTFHHPDFEALHGMHSQHIQTHDGTLQIAHGDKLDPQPIATTTPPNVGGASP